MVRHEVGGFQMLNACLIIKTQAAEAMGAISDATSIPILKEFLADSERTVRETCEIAIAKIEWDNSEEGQKNILNANESTIP